jgi:tetratricopeptide (TPR) repeat protein
MLRLLLLVCLVSACLAQVEGVGAPARADPAPAPSGQWPRGLPGDWRMLGGEGPGPADQGPGRFDFRRDGAQSPLGPAPGADQNPGLNAATPADPTKPADPEKAAAAAKAAAAKARSEALKRALAPRPEPAVAHQRAMDDLFRRLGAASDPQEAKAVAETIRRLWMQTQSDTASLIMQRAMLASEARNYKVALTLLDRLVALEPNWAEAWNQRATVRFLNDDSEGSMADIDRVIKLEPRHFGALTGMGVILRRAGLDKRALEVFNKALELYPAQPDLRETVEKLGLQVNGRDI